VCSTKKIDLTLFRAWLPARPHQDFDLIVKIVGAAATGLVKDWMLIAQSLILKMIRGGSDCFTLALCTFNGDDEAHFTIRDLAAETILRLVESVHRQKRARPSLSSQEDMPFNLFS